MKLMISQGNINLELDSRDPIDFAYIVNEKPYTSSTTHDPIKKYRVPLTPISLNKLINHFKIDLNGMQMLKTVLLQLNCAIMFNNLKPDYENRSELLRPYQQQGVDWLKLRLDVNHSKSACLFWAMRTGKTRTACIGTQHYNKIIVLALAGQEKNWIDTYKDCSNRECLNLHKKSLDKRLLIYKEFIDKPTAILVGSMDTIKSDLMKGYFNPTAFDILIIDEIHKAKNTSTQLYKACGVLRKKADKCVGLTGTPVSKKTNEILPLFGLLWPERFSKTYLSNYFFTKIPDSWSQWDLIGDVKAEKKTEWIEFMGLYFSQVTEKQALPWATEPNVEVVKLELTGKQLKTYERVLQHNEFQRTDGEVEQIQEVVAQFTRLRQLSLDPHLINIDANSVKDEWLAEYLAAKDYEAVIVFSTLTSYLDSLYSKLIKNGYKVGLITGKTKNKTEVANDFQSGKYDIILANIQAGSKGITLDRADAMIFLDEDWRPDENKQAAARFTATTEDRVKLRTIYRLEISNVFNVNGIPIYSMDRYINDVVTGKIKQTELINNFKEIFHLQYMGGKLDENN